MVDMTARQKFILNTIIEKGPLNVKDLSQQIYLSNRTISREIAIINNFLMEKNIIIREHASKLNIIGENEAIKKLQQILVGIPLQWLLSQDQKLLLITAQLLVADEPYKAAFFSYQFNVVEGTISLYMDRIEKWLNVHNLTLKRKRGYGIIVNGSEWIKRNSIMELLYLFKPINELLDFLYGSKNDPTIKSFFKTIFGGELMQISKKLLELINNEIMHMDDMTYFSTYIYILLSLKKTKHGVTINLPPYLIQDVLSSNEFLFIHKIKEDLLSLNVSISNEELTYIAIQLMGNKYVYNTDREFQELGIPLERLSAEIVFEVERKLNIHIDCDEQLILGLVQHFNPALYRINMGIQVKNHLINQIKEHYGDLFKTVNYACKLVFSNYNITMPQDEIGFVTMHIGAALERSNLYKNKLSALVICPNGIGTSQILSNKIMAAVPNIKSVTISSFKDWKEDYNDYDIILSTVIIDNKNIIIVSPFLNNDDVIKINDFIKKSSTENYLFTHLTELSSNDKIQDFKKDEYDMLNDILANLRIEYVDSDSFNGIVKLITQKLFDEKLVNDEEEIENLIIKRQEMGNVVIPNCHVALLHTRSDNVRTPFAGVYRLKQQMFLKSVGFEDENVDTFILLLARKNESSYVLENMGKISISLIENKQFAEILRYGDIKDLRSSLIKILDEEDN